MHPTGHPQLFQFLSVGSGPEACDGPDGPLLDQLQTLDVSLGPW